MTDYYIIRARVGYYVCKITEMDYKLNQCKFDIVSHCVLYKEALALKQDLDRNTKKYNSIVRDAS